MSLDILNDNTPVDLSTVRTAMPIIKAAPYAAVVKEIDITPNKKGDGSNMNLSYTLVNSAETVEGKTLNPGFTVFDTVSLVRTFKEDGTTVSYDPMARLNEIRAAVTGQKTGSMTGRQLVDEILTYGGRPISFRTKVETSDQYGDKTRIARYIPAS